MLHKLPALAWQTVREVYQALLGENATPGGIIAIQTFGNLIHFHPHLHGLITEGAFTPEGNFHPIPLNLTHESFLHLWEHKIFRLLLDEGLIETSLIDQMRSWRHSGFHVDRSVLLPRGDRAAIERLAQYMARCPFSLSRLVRITGEGKVLYKAEKDHCQEYPEPASEDLFGGRGGVSRNFQVFDPLDFLAELTQHIPNQGEHLIRYYGCYSNKARGLARKQNAAPPDATAFTLTSPAPSLSDRRTRRRWAILIKRIYHADPLLCPTCGGAMKVISFIEAHQTDVIRKILQHCGLWRDPPPRSPPHAPPSGRVRGGDSTSQEIDPEFLEHLHREGQQEQLGWSWD